MARTDSTEITYLQQYCVLFLKNKKEHRTPWFSNETCARKALAIMQNKYGDKNVIIYQN